MVSVSHSLSHVFTLLSSYCGKRTSDIRILLAPLRPREFFFSKEDSQGTLSPHLPHSRSLFVPHTDTHSHTHTLSLLPHTHTYIHTSTHTHSLVYLTHPSFYTHTLLPLLRCLVLVLRPLILALKDLTDGKRPPTARRLSHAYSFYPPPPFSFTAVGFPPYGMPVRTELRPSRPACGPPITYPPCLHTNFCAHLNCTAIDQYSFSCQNTPALSRSLSLSLPPPPLFSTHTYPPSFSPSLARRSLPLECHRRRFPGCPRQTLRKRGARSRRPTAVRTTTTP